MTVLSRQQLQPFDFARWPPDYRLPKPIQDEESPHQSEAKQVTNVEIHCIQHVLIGTVPISNERVTKRVMAAGTQVDALGLVGQLLDKWAPGGVPRFLSPDQNGRRFSVHSRLPN